jgi:DNA-directed RNA polymerase specialized sigma subunit
MNAYPIAEGEINAVHEDSFEEYVHASGPRLKRVGFLLTGDLNQGSGATAVDDSVVDTDALLAALRALPDRQRAAVVLRHWCDLSETETAETMGCSVGTVKSTTSRGLAGLRAALASASDVHPKDR